MPKKNCEFKYLQCTNKNVKKVEDPYEADVNNTPGVMVWSCPECLAERTRDI